MTRASGGPLSVNLGLFLLPVLAGYWFLTRLYFTRSDVLRDSGYHLFFKSAIAGFALGLLAYLIIFVLKTCELGIGEWWEFLLPSSTDFSYHHGVLSVLLGFAAPLVINPFYDRERAERRTANERGHLIELLIAESFDRSELVEISLRSGKSYIGFALDSRMTRRGESDVALLPMASGYRDEGSQKLKITNNYEDVILEYSGSENSSVQIKDFRVVFPMSDIVSARIFLPKVWRRFRQENQEIEESSTASVEKTEAERAELGPIG